MNSVFRAVIILTMIIGCTNDDHRSYKKVDMFTLDIQMAGYEIAQSDQKGQTDFADFVKTFEAFPWLDQIEESKRHIGKSEPTLNVTDHLEHRDLWVSMIGDRNRHAYLIGYNFPKTFRGFLGLGKPKVKKWVEIYVAETPELVTECFQLFFQRKYSQLEARIRQLEKYDEMEVYIQD